MHVAQTTKRIACNIVLGKILRNHQHERGLLFAGLIPIEFRRRLCLVAVLIGHQRAHLSSLSSLTHHAVSVLCNTDIARQYLQLNPLPPSTDQLPAWIEKRRQRIQRCMYREGNNPYARKLPELTRPQLPPVLLANISRLAQQRAVSFYINKIVATGPTHAANLETVRRILGQTSLNEADETVLETVLPQFAIYESQRNN